MNDHQQRTDVVCTADVAKEPVLATRTARETFGNFKN